MQNKNQKIDVSFSHNTYSHKPTSRDYASMNWNNATVTIRELLEHIKQGFSYCHVFEDNKRKKEKFLYAQLITIDVDNSEIPMNEFVGDLALKPTLAYTTFSNRLNDDSAYRFHLVYCFRERIYADQYKVVYQALSDIATPNNDDNCGKSYCQIMNGNSLENIETYMSEYMYQLSDFISTNLSNSHKQQTSLSLNYTDKQLRSNETNTMFNILQKDPLEEYLLPTTQYRCDESFCNNYNKQFYSDFNSMPLSKFVYTYREIPLIEGSELRFNENGYTIIPDDYNSVFTRIRWIDGACRVVPYRDGEKRRNRLFTDACIIKKIKPNITFEQLLYNLSYRVLYCYDNSDGVLSRKLIESKARDAIKKDVDKMSFENSRRGKITTSKSFCVERGLNRRSYARTATKIENHKKIKQWYDESKSVAENFEHAKEIGISTSKSTLKRYCKENGINFNPNRIPIEQWYDVSKSVTENYNYAKIMKYDISKSALYIFCKKSGYKTKGLN